MATCSCRSFSGMKSSAKFQKQTLLYLSINERSSSQVNISCTVIVESYYHNSHCSATVNLTGHSPFFRGVYGKVRACWRASVFQPNFPAFRGYPGVKHKGRSSCRSSVWRRASGVRSLVQIGIRQTDLMDAGALRGLRFLRGAGGLAQAWRAPHAGGHLARDL